MPSFAREMCIRDRPNLARLGLGNMKPLQGIPPAAVPTGAYGRCTLASPGKDTTTGHWEMVGIHLAHPFPLYPHGFPAVVLDEFERRIGRHWLGNVAASGTEIIRDLGAEHMRTGSPIVYTSADSVFQVAAHEEVIPLWEQYKICETAREILRGPHEVGRVIARPFIGAPGNFTRTANRHDYAVPPPAGMLLDRIEERGVLVLSLIHIFQLRFPPHRAVHHPVRHAGRRNLLLRVQYGRRLEMCIRDRNKSWNHMPAMNRKFQRSRRRFSMSSMVRSLPTVP